MNHRGDPGRCVKEFRGNLERIPAELLLCISPIVLRLYYLPPGPARQTFRDRRKPGAGATGLLPLGRRAGLLFDQRPYGRHRTTELVPEHLASTGLAVRPR